MKFIVYLILLFSTVLAHSTTIEFVVKAAPGGPDDVITRKIVEHIERDTDLKFAVINKAGAAHVIGYNYFESKTTPALILADSNMRNHPVIHLSERLFVAGDFTNILFVKNGVGINSLNDLIMLSKEREIRFGHGGIGTYSWLASDAICQKVLRCLLVPYRSGAPGMLDVLTGSIDAFALISYGSSSFVSNDMYRAIVMFSTQKHPSLNISLLPKQYRELEIRNWVAIYGRNLSSETRRTIQQSINKIPNEFFIENGLYK
jgi:tripartite-type tricarboxylate transporter receptor subunit TctC